MNTPTHSFRSHLSAPPAARRRLATSPVPSLSKTQSNFDTRAAFRDVTAIVAIVLFIVAAALFDSHIAELIRIARDGVPQ